MGDSNIYKDKSNENLKYKISYEGNHDKIKSYFNESEYLSMFFRGGLYFDSVVDLRYFLNDKFDVVISEGILSDEDKLADELMKYRWKLNIYLKVSQTSKHIKLA